jgi:cytochrome c-type biogenesis protein CcmH
VTSFLIASACLLLMALAVVTWPLLRRHATGRALHRDVDALALQLRQLRELHDAGALTDEQFAASKVRLERRVIDILGPSAGGEVSASGSRRLALALAVFMLLVTAGGYWFVGSPRHLDLAPGQVTASAAPPQADATDTPTAPHELTPAQIEEMVDQLAERLKSHPDDAQGWTMLARSRVALGQHDKALDAFAHAERLQPKNADLLADYADALAMAHGRSLEGAPSELLQRALAIDPHHAKALALDGTAAFDRKDYKQAVRDWETLERVAPADSPLAQQVRDGIAEARQLGGMPPAAASATTFTLGPAQHPLAATLSGTVTLASALSGRASPDDVLFVFARAVDGPRMPVAIVRKRVADLPFTFTLDDSMAMAPEANLSSVRRVIVGARISHSGSAMPQAGDLQGTTPAVDVGTSGLTLVIDQAVGQEAAR